MVTYVTISLTVNSLLMVLIAMIDEYLSSNILLTLCVHNK